MARERGTFNFSASLEIKKEGALDARQVVQTKAGLIQASTWLDDDDKIWLYNGLLVCVVADTEDNNGVYFLKDKDNYTTESNWIKVAAISGSTPAELEQSIANALAEAKNYTDTKVGSADFSDVSHHYIHNADNVTDALIALDEQVNQNFKTISGVEGDISELKQNTVLGIKMGSNDNIEPKGDDNIVTLSVVTEDNDGVLSKEDYSKLLKGTIANLDVINNTSSQLTIEAKYLSILNPTNTWKETMFTLDSATQSLAGLLSAADKTKVDKLVINSAGTKFLSDDGTYKEVSASSKQEIYTIVPSSTANAANASVYTLLKNNSNVVVVYKDNDLFFPVSWSYTATNAFMGSAITYNYTSSAVETENYDWVSYDINIHSDGVCYCTKRSLNDTFGALSIYNFFYPSEGESININAQVYLTIRAVGGYTTVVETNESGSVIKHIGKITKTPDNVTIVCTEGNTQITYVCTPDGNITKQEADITIDWSDIQSKPTIPSAYTLPIASTDTLGGIKVGGGLTINSSGVLSATGGGVADSVDIENVAGLNSSWLTLLQSTPSRYVTTDPTWALVTGKPSTFTPSAHTHTATEVTGLAEVATSGDYNDLINKPAATTLSSLGVTATAAELNYVDGVTSNIQTQLNGKAASNHTHAMNSITDRGTITFTGAVSGTYDGTNDISVNIPTAGGGVADSVDWSNITNKPSWIGSTKPSYNYNEIAGTIPIADIPTGTSSTTVALGNHTHNQYLTSIPSEYITQTELNSTLADYATTDDIPSLSGYATQSWVNSQGFIKSEYALPVATADTLGGIRVGAGLVINGSGVLSVTGGGTADAVDLDNVTGMNSTWKTLLASAPTRYVTADPTWEQVTGKPTFATVATSGSYDDLTNKPTIPSLSGYATQTWVNGLIDAITPASIGAAASSHSHVFSDITFNNTGTSAQYLAGDGSFHTVGWNEIGSKPSTFTPSSHTHSASDIISGTLAIARIPTGTTSSTVALGNHTHSNYLTSSSLSGYATQSWVQSQGYITTAYTLPTASASTLGGIKIGAGLSISSAGVLSATGGGVADAVDWDNITSKPSWVDSTSKPTYTWSEISGKPSSFTPSSHTHNAADITEGTLALARIPTGTSSSTVALGNHTHSNYATTTEVDNLTYADVGAASASHTHGTDDVTALIGYTEGTSTSTLTSSMTLNAALASLQNQVQAKANSSHTHTISQITNMGTLTFTGAATGSYDGSGNLTINIPESSSVDTSNFVTLNGTQTITGTKTFTQYTVFSSGAGTSSDERLKSNIRPIDNPFDILNGLHGHKYVLKSNNEEKLGLIAQEVEKILPEAVITDETGYKSVDTYPIIAVLVETIKELKKEIEELKSKL